MTHPRAPVVIASANGNIFRNGGPETCVERAFALIVSGRDVLDALVEGVSIVELDPQETSVGYGGLPNADGVVQLDASCMHGARKTGAGVAALEGVATAARVAQLVMEQTDHHLLAGRGASEFARRMGLPVREDLNSAKSREIWREWKRRVDAAGGIGGPAGSGALRQIELSMIADGWIDANHFYGTIHCSAVNGEGAVSGVTSTSGLAWKPPGRVGDSPVLGAGLYVDGSAGAAGSTGRGEANLYGLSAFVIVECMRRGMHPKDAGLEALGRVAANTVAPRLLNTRGRPNFNVNFYVLNTAGEFAGVSMYSEGRFAVCTRHGAEIRNCEPLFDGSSTD
ncbi:MAG TPA: isoaspartyl peptidase/L-asparaginase [Vicinamibacterales bacterium]|nr:isoaspartyl peptidase/L-asparaginase [Vicinamibacterales bacterium]